MTDLYRRLLKELTERFGGAVDDANADAIAYAAAELYHRDFEPRLWQEKSAHDLLDLFGVPRGSGLAQYSLSDRLVLFQRRSGQAQYVTRAHEVLTALGVPRQDENGVDQTLKWRLDRILESVNGEQSQAGKASDGSGESDAKAAAATVEVRNNPAGDTDGAAETGAKAAKEKDEKEDDRPEPAAALEVEGSKADAAAEDGKAEAAADGKVPSAEDADAAPVTPLELPDEPTTANGRDETGGPAPEVPTVTESPAQGPVAPTENGSAEPSPEATKSPTESRTESPTGTSGPESVAVEAEGKPEAGESKAPEQSKDPKEPETVLATEAEKNGAPASEPAVSAPAVGETDSAKGTESEPSPAQLVDAVRALEKAAEVEAQLATAPEGSGVDLLSLTETLTGIQGEIAALRELVEAFEIGMRRQLDQLEARLIAGNQETTLAPAPSEPAPLLPRPTDPTHEMPPVLVDESEAEAAAQDEPGRRKGRRALLVVLLVLLGVLIAGGIAVGVALGWDAIRDKAGLLLPYALAGP